MEVPQKIKNETALSPTNSTSGYIYKKTQKTNSKKCLYPYPWLVWFSALSTSLWTERFNSQSARGNWSVFPSFSLPSPFCKNKWIKSCTPMFHLPPTTTPSVRQGKQYHFGDEDLWRHLNAMAQVILLVITPSPSFHSLLCILCSSLTEQGTTLGTCHEFYPFTALLLLLPLSTMFLLYFDHLLNNLFLKAQLN